MRAMRWMRALWRRLVPERARHRIYQWRRRAAIGLAADPVGAGSAAPTPSGLSVLFRAPPLATSLLHHGTEGSVLDRPAATGLVPYQVGGRERLATCSGVSWFRGHHLAVVNLYGGHLRIYRFEPERLDRAEPARLRLLHERSEGISCPEDVAVSPDGRLLAVTHSLSKRNRVSLHRIDPESLEPGPAFETLGSGHTCHGACFSPDSRYLVFTEVGGAGVVEVVDVTASPARRTCRLENRLPAMRPKSVCFTRDGRYVMVAHSSLARPHPGSTAPSGRLAIHRFDAATGVIEEGCETFVSGVAIGAVEMVSFLAGGDGAAYRLVATDQATDRVLELIFDPRSRSLRVSGRQVHGLSFPHGVDVSADGDLLAVTTYGDDCLRVLRLTPEACPIRDGRKHVLLCGHRASPPLMGAERSLLDLAAALSRLGYRVSCLLPEEHPAYTLALSEHVEQIVHLPFPWWSRDRPFEEETVARIEEFLRREEVDLVHVNTSVILDPLVAARRAGVPSVLHVRELLADDPSLAERLGCDGAAAVRRLQREADFLIANSRATHRMFGVKGRSFCLRNAVDTERFDVPEIRDRGPLRVGMVSSNHPKKGIGDLFDLAMQARSDPGLEFLAIGPRGEGTRPLEEAVERASPRPRLRFVEFVPDPGPALAMVDVVLSLTRVGESFGRSVAEAMAARRPVIAYACGAMPELVVHGQTGFLVPAGDLERVLHCLRELEQDRLRAREMGRAGRRRMQETFSVAGFERSLDAIYRWILATASAPGARAVGGHGTSGSRRGLSA